MFSWKVLTWTSLTKNWPPSGQDFLSSFDHLDVVAWEFLDAHVSLRLVVMDVGHQLVTIYSLKRKVHAICRYSHWRVQNLSKIAEFFLEILIFSSKFTLCTTCRRSFSLEGLLVRSRTRFCRNSVDVMARRLWNGTDTLDHCSLKFILRESKGQRSKWAQNKK